MGDPASIAPLENVVTKDSLTYKKVPVEIFVLKDSLTYKKASGSKAENQRILLC